MDLEFTFFRNDIYFYHVSYLRKLYHLGSILWSDGSTKLWLCFSFLFFFFLYFSFFIIIFSRFSFFCFIYLFDVMNGKGLIEGRSVLANDPYSLPGLFW